MRRFLPKTKTQAKTSPKESKRKRQKKIQGDSMNKKNNIAIYAVFTGLVLIVVWFTVAIVVSFLLDSKRFNVLTAVLSGLTNWRVWVLWGAITVGLTLTLILRNTYSAKRVLKINDGENAKWLSDTDIRHADNLTVSSYSHLNDVQDGVPIYAKQQGKGLTVVLAKPIHTLVIGTTGSGKTSGFVDPVIQILARTKTKPGLVITDPKGEIFRSHAATLVEKGYKVLVIDLSDPYRSARWNPFADIIQRTHIINTLKIEQQQGKYIFDNTTYLTYAEAENEMNVYRQQLVDETMSDLQDIIQTLCPIESSQDPSWQQGARSFIQGIACAMWEDLRDGFCDEKEFNLFSLYKNVTDYAKGDCEVFRDYFAHRDKFSKASSMANTVLVATDRTLTSYLSEVNGYMAWLSDTGICALTAENDVDLSAFDDEPTALFIKIPDEKENRHRIVTVLITQLYKTLVSKARRNYKTNATKDEELKRNVYVIMDEFGNMPKFQSIDKIITVGRSRRIFMLPIIQDYAQLNNKYGKELASIVRSNCNIKIFIGSTDKTTIQEFSELCGKTKQKRISYSDQTVDKMSVSVSAESKPLIYPSELETLNDPPNKMGNAIVVAFGKSPLKATFTPVFKALDVYCPSKSSLSIMRQAEVFDEEAHFFDIYVRNAFIASEAENSAKQNEPLESLVATSPSQEKSAYELYGAIISSRLDGIRPCLPNELITVLDEALASKNASAFIDGCDTVMDYAITVGDRLTLNDTAKLKVLFANLFKEITNERKN